MRHEDEEPIDRDAWRRRLGDAGAPPAATDFVIRAEARRVLTPRTSRWWLPASPRMTRMALCPSRTFTRSRSSSSRSLVRSRNSNAFFRFSSESTLCPRFP